jgi:2-dehydro-3-deoxyglucarate aldolase/4-hydroxy-2-oxoheptanedioate aldolase
LVRQGESGSAAEESCDKSQHSKWRFFVAMGVLFGLHHLVTLVPSSPYFCGNHSMHNARAFRDKLDRGDLCFGTGIGLSDPNVTEALCGDLDFFWVDMEHTALSLQEVKYHLMAIKGSGTAALVRVPWNDQALIKPVIDIGADGVIVPMIETADDVARAVAACRYPPQGTRGFGPLRPLDYGRRNLKEYYEQANADIIIVVQIEQAAAVENIDEILAVPGLTSIAFGPNDLSTALGYRGEPAHPEVLKVMQTITDKARAAKIPVGVSVGADPAHLAQLANMGIQWLSMGLDVTLMRRAAAEVVDKVKARYKPK